MQLIKPLLITCFLIGFVEISSAQIAFTPDRNGDWTNWQVPDPTHPYISARASQAHSSQYIIQFQNTDGQTWYISYTLTSQIGRWTRGLYMPAPARGISPPYLIMMDAHDGTFYMNVTAVDPHAGVRRSPHPEPPPRTKSSP